MNNHIWQPIIVTWLNKDYWLTESIFKFFSVESCGFSMNEKAQDEGEPGSKGAKKASLK